MLNFLNHSGNDSPLWTLIISSSSIVIIIIIIIIIIISLCWVDKSIVLYTYIQKK